MSVTVRGLRADKSKKWVDMKAMWDICTRNNMPVPAAVLNFFGDRYPFDAESSALDIPWTTDYFRDGEPARIEIKTSNIPRDTELIVVEFFIAGLQNDRELVKEQP